MRSSSDLRCHLIALIICMGYVIHSSAQPGLTLPSIGIVQSNASSLLARPSVNLEKIDYIITPNEPGNPHMSRNVYRRLLAIVPRSDIVPFTSPHTQIEFWVVAATEQQRQLLASIPGVTVEEDIDIVENDLLETSTFNTSSQNLRGPRLQPNVIIRDKYAREDLRVISWPNIDPRPTLEDLKSYSYQENGREGSYIYIIENGIDPGAPDFGDMTYGLRRRDWHFAPRHVRLTETDDDPEHHGSCMASKAAGARFGVSKESRLIILKAAQKASNIRWAFYTARDDIMANNRQGQSVVLFAKSDPVKGETYTGPWTGIRSYMQQLFDMDVVVVTSAGNKGTRSGRQQIDTVPQLWESPDFPLVVAGAVYNTGLLVPSSQGPNHVTAWAPGYNVGCVVGPSTAASGTSTSAAAVAGLVAYFLGLNPRPFIVGGGNTARNAKRFLRGGGSWQRSVAGPPYVVWNGQDGTVPAPRLNTSDTQGASDVATA